MLDAAGGLLQAWPSANKQYEPLVDGKKHGSSPVEGVFRVYAVTVLLRCRTFHSANSLGLPRRAKAGRPRDVCWGTERRAAKSMSSEGARRDLRRHFRPLADSSSHVSVIDEQTRHDRGLPLVSSVAMSSTSWGGYDLFNICDLVRGRTWELAFFRSFDSLSDIARGPFCSIIAYEAYFEGRDPEGPFILRMLSGRMLDGNSAFIALDPIGAYDYTPHEQIDIACRMSALLTGLNFQGASSLLASDKAHAGMSAT
ncbi:hypothetical protein DL764_000985 [Monosporascus ibericus]|uniref:Uncharacterized protein n=1 Tax=Monosporascus ibericus TaxID=155417 RepID=A0A4Q4TWH6_9PEZI|nr:hypothetical protein DL764_000985 [Monosporascus ibericus]